MAEPRRSLIRRIFRLEPGVSVGQWILDRLLADWWQWLSAVAGGIAVSWASSLTAFMNLYGPISWVVGGILAALVIGLLLSWIRLIAASARNKNANAAYVVAVTNLPHSINPLRSNFEQERIKLSDFFSHFAIPHSRKLFRECEIHGPGAIALVNVSHLNECKMRDCDFVLLNKPTVLHTVTRFEMSTFDRCKFYNVTFILDLGTIKAMEADFKNYGRPMPEIIGYDAISTP